MPTIPEQKPIRVLQLVQALDIGGLEQVVIDILQGFEDSIVSGYLGCLSHPGKQANNAKASKTWTGSDKIHSKFLSFEVLRSLIRFLKANKIDIIHSHNPVPHRYAYFASLFTGIPIVHTKHGRNYPKNKKAVFLNRLYTSRTKRIVAVSKDAAQVSTKVEKIHPKKVTTAVNGINTARFQPRPDKAIETRKNKGVSEHSFVVGSVGRLAKEKDYPLLVESFAKAFPDQEGAQLLLVGDGSDKNRILEKAKELGIENRVLLPGMQTETEKWYPCMDVFCLTSITEGTSITLLESAASGVPAVVAD
ncbi:MAG: glycosyltransferase, partial [Opitutales bacterium]|nr:glycosyltransferase [Opitutales bacterium]